MDEVSSVHKKQFEVTNLQLVGIDSVRSTFAILVNLFFIARLHGNEFAQRNYRTLK
jgi:hypothetical protein